MSLTILSPAMYGRLAFLISLWQPVSEKENSEFKTSKILFLELSLCQILFVGRRVGKYVHSLSG